MQRRTESLLRGSLGKTLEKAIMIATEAHKGQTDKAGKPYILHPLRVMGKMESTSEQIVAVLHDLLEDTSWTKEDLTREGFDDEIIQAVDHLTRDEEHGETYDDFIKRVSKNKLATRVKLADLEDNMDVTRLGALTQKDYTRVDKYKKAWNQLSDIKQY